MSTMFESTISPGEPELMRASRYVRYLQSQTTQQPTSITNSLSIELSPSMLSDLSRFDSRPNGAEVLEVMAACVRHAKQLTLQLHCGRHVIPLTVFPHERLAHSPLSLDHLLSMPLAEMRVIHVEPPALSAPDGSESISDLAAQHYHPLAPLLWELALRGPQDTLLPEIAGTAAYRVAPSLNLSALLNSELLARAVRRLRIETTNLRTLSEWPGLDRERAIRLLNAIYLQSGLIVTRSHPDAVSNRWFSTLGQR